jgi:hypothetical protein
MNSISNSIVLRDGVYGELKIYNKHFTLKILKLEENLQKNNFSKVSFRICMYNLLIAQSESISKLSRYKRELRFSLAQIFSWT